LALGRLSEAWWDLDNLPPIYADISSRDAAGHLAMRLMKDMVFDNEDWLSFEEATECARTFYSFFTFGSSVRLANRIRDGWNPITSSTFEAAYIAMDDLNIGLFLIEAED
jgi:hypothetical protein